MTTARYKSRVFGLGALLALALGVIIPTATAGPGNDYWRRMDQVRTQKQVAEIIPGSTVMMVCGACKSVSVTEFKSQQPNGRSTPRWFEVGSKHECDHCGGTITVVNGKTADEMQHNCSKCGEGAAFCCAAAPDKG